MSIKKQVVGAGTALVLIGALAAPAMADRKSSAPPQSIARQWDEQLLSAIRIDLPRPPVHARNLYHLSVAMYDAWAAYDTVASQVVHRERATAGNIEVARAETISFAAYRILKNRFTIGPGTAVTNAALDAKMTSLGYDKNFTSTVGSSPAALGNRIAASVIAFGMGDGSNQVANYVTNNGYLPVNDPLIIALAGTTMIDPNRWQPLAFDYYVTQNGIPIGTFVQAFVCPHWEGVKPFCLRGEDHQNVVTYFDPGPPPYLGGVGDAQFKANVIDIIRKSSMLDPADNTTLDIGPHAHGNNTLGYNDGTGYAVNPYTGQPYAPNIVKRADYGRVLAEFWADGPNSETPPGHWNVLANYVSDSPMTVKRIGGTGPIVSDLEWDVKLYLAINGAVHDSAVACWGCKNVYDYVRPISMIRWMGGLGQCTNLGGPSYHPLGLPLVPGLTAVITAADVQPGGQFAHLVEDYIDPVTQLPVHDDHVGDLAIFAWKGQPANPATQVGGTGWILATKWITYQKSTFVTPPFAAYTSGHSTFSRAAAEVLAQFTGSSYFPGGLGTFTAQQNAYLEFELGPSQTVTLQWARYYDASDEAGISRLWGGIHVEADDRGGRIMGSEIGMKSYAQALKYFQGHGCSADVTGTSNQVNIDDLVTVITEWGPCHPAEPCFGDVVVNGTVNIDDLVQVITHWGACP